MGATIASRLTVIRPDLIRALILVRPAWICANAPANMQPDAELGRLLADHPAPQARAIFTTGPTAPHLVHVATDNLNSLMGFSPATRRPIPLAS